MLTYTYIRVQLYLMEEKLYLRRGVTVVFRGLDRTP